MKKLFITFIIYICFLNISFGADLKKGLEAAKNKDYETAYLEWLPLAKEGDPWAQYNIGQMYRQGHGLEKNSEMAFEWYLKAANQGLGIAQFAVGASYSNADGISRDYQEAFEWFNLAAKQQNYSAQYQIGRIYYYGVGREKDIILSHMWLNIASFNGSEEAKNFLIPVSDKLDKNELMVAREMARECVRNFYINCEINSLKIENEKEKNILDTNQFNSDEVKISKEHELSDIGIDKKEKKDKKLSSNQNVKEENTKIEEKIKNNTIQNKPFKVIVSSLSVRSCPSKSCGRLRVIPKNYKLIVSEIKNNWARISRYYEALCNDGASPLIERGNKKCVPENGIKSNKLSEWVYLDYIKMTK